MTFDLHMHYIQSSHTIIMLAKRLAYNVWGSEVPGLSHDEQAFFLRFAVKQTSLTGEISKFQYQ